MIRYVCSTVKAWRKCYSIMYFALNSGVLVNVERWRHYCGSRRWLTAVSEGIALVVIIISNNPQSPIKGHFCESSVKNLYTILNTIQQQVSNQFIFLNISTLEIVFSLKVFRSYKVFTIYCLISDYFLQDKQTTIAATLYFSIFSTEPVGK